MEPTLHQAINIVVIIIIIIVIFTIVIITVITKPASGDSGSEASSVFVWSVTSRKPVLRYLILHQAYERQQRYQVPGHLSQACPKKVSSYSKPLRNGSHLGC